MTRGQTAGVDTNALPPISPDWRYESVGALGRPDEQAVLTGPFGTNLGRNDFVERGVPVLTIGCLTEGGITLDKALYVSEEKARELERYRLREGDLLFSRMASVGRAGMVPRSLEGALFNYHIMRLRLDESQIDPRVFINYVRGARQVRDYLKAANHGATRDGINTEQLLGMPVAIPPLPRQRELVAEIEKQFSRLDEAVATLKRVKANLDRYLAATLGEAFSGDWEGTEADWRPVALREVADVQLGQQRAPVHAADENPVPYVRAANVTWRGLDLCDVKSMGFPNVARYRLVYGDILLAEASGSANEVGKPAVWRDEIPGACYQKTLIRVRCLPDRLNFEFAYYFFLHTAVSGQFARLAPGVGILHLTAERMLVWPIVAPPLRIQTSVVAEVDRRLSIVREVEAEVDATLTRARTLRQAVLGRAFSGASLDRERRVASRT